MTEIIINRARACAVTGHRAIPKNIDTVTLKNTFYTLINGGYDTFLIGMALGFDTLCFNVLEEIKKEKDIKIIACIPCRDQAKKYNIEQFKEYNRMVSVADERVYISDEYTKNCMLKRNRYMVDNCSILVAYKIYDFSGTAYTVDYAKKKNVPITYIGEIK